AAYPGLALAAGPAAGAMQSAPAAKSEAMKMAKPMAHAAKATTGDLTHWTAWNSRVRDVQEALNKQPGDKLVVDGILGAKTRAAIKAFQAKNGLAATGIPNRATLDKMHVVPRSA
ncbi:MAG: peptidoglycan-binding domain-containing protein, partial [Candidatus Eiseniibacteriota bacterium]